MEDCYEEKIQHDIQAGGNCEKYKRNNGIPKGAQQGCEKVVEEDSDQPGKDHDQIFMHQFNQIRGRLQHPDDPVDSREYDYVENEGDNAQQDERSENPFF